jgi:hypothetical protein
MEPVMYTKREEKIIFRFEQIELPAGSPDDIAVSLARFFYTQMRKQDLDENQIIRVAGELISCLTASLDGYKKKVSFIEDPALVKKRNGKNYSDR